MMKKQQHTIECGRCGETRQEFLTEEETKKLNDVAGPIYRDCAGCGKTTGWIGSAHPPVATKEPILSLVQNPPVNGRTNGSQPLKGQERMATQDERDDVNSMLRNDPHSVSKV